MKIIRTLLVTFALLVTTLAPTSAQILPGEARAVVPVVGSTAGAFGANFKTELQLHNDGSEAMTGTLVFRAAGQPGTIDDPSLAYELEAFETKHYEDVVDQMGASGLGSLDIIPDTGSKLPTAVFRAFDDKDEAGTTGVTVPMVLVTKALTSGKSSALIVPSDLARFRFNIGVRTLAEGATLHVTLYNADGTVAEDLGERSYPGHYFEQRPAVEFLGVAPEPDQSVGITVVAGRTIVYGTTTDNKTNDGSIQLDEIFNSAPIVADPAGDGSLLITASTTTGEPVTITAVVSDDDGDPIQYVLGSAPGHGSVGDVIETEDGFLIVYTPEPGFLGEDEFTIVIGDGEDAVTLTIRIVVSEPGNTIPTADDVAVTTMQGTSVDVTMTGSDADGDHLAFSIATPPSDGTLSSVSSINSTSAGVTYTPAAPFSGTDSCEIKVDDGRGGVVRATVTITVTPVVNRAPVATDQTVSMAIDTAASFTLLASDPDGDTLTYSIDTTPGNGTLSGTAPNLTYTPNTGYSGNDGFSWSVSDGRGGSDSAVVTLTVAAAGNEPPVANDRTANTNEDTPVSVTLVATDADGDTLSYTIASAPSYGTLSGTAPNLTYTPNADFNGVEIFTWVANDGTTSSNTATVTVIVRPVNDAPEAAADAYGASEDTVLSVPAPGVLGNDSDVDGDTLNASVSTTTTSGALTLSADGSFTYTPNGDFNGTDSFTYSVSDGNGGAETAVATITVTAVNDAPVAGDGSVTTDEDSPVAVSLTASDLDGDPLSYTVGSGPSNGTLSGTAPNLTYTPSPDFNGADTFTFTASDGTASSNVATITITVNPVNDAPVADAQAVTTAEDTAVAIALTGSDIDGDVLSYTVATPPASGALSGTAPNLTYTANANFNGSDSFTFTVHDGTVSSAAATVSITVTAVNDVPLAADDSYTVDEGGTIPIAASGVLGNDFDVESALTAVLGTNVLNGTLVLNADGSFTYTHDGSETTSDSFTYTASDGTAVSNVATVSITVTPVNDAPVIDLDADDSQGTTGSDFAVTFTENDPATLLEDATDAVISDADHTTIQSLTVTLTNLIDVGSELVDADVTSVPAITKSYDTTTDPTVGVLTLAGPATIAELETVLRTVTYRNVSDDPDTTARVVTFVANDGTDASNPAISTVTIVAENDAPVFTSSAGTNVDEDAAYSYSITTTDHDGADILTITAPVLPVWLTLTDGGDGTATLSGTPTNVEVGTHDVTLRVNDGTVDVNQSFTITVANVNDAPTITSSLAVTTPENGTAASSVTATDDEGDTLSFSISGGADGPLFAIDATSGALSFISPKDFENPVDSDSDNDYLVEVTVNDGNGGTDVQTLTVTVTDVSEALQITTQPSAVVQSGVQFPTQPVIQFTDNLGNPVPQAGIQITVAIASGGGNLSGTTTVSTDAAGSVTFGDLAISGTVGDRTLLFSATAAGATAVTSGTITVGPGPGSQLTFMVQPANTAAGVPITPAVQVAIEDAFGNTVTGATDSITIAIGTNAGGGTLSGTKTVAAVNGVATFSDLSIELSGNGYTVSAASGTLIGATSSTFNITHAAADNLAFTAQPSNTTAGASIGPAVQVTIRDQFGNTVTSATDNVTIAIGTNPGGGTLSGTTTVAAASGVATFPDLSIDRSGVGYTITAGSGALTGATSGTFDITAAAASNVAFTVQPSNATAGVSISPAVQVTIRDQFGNTVTNATDNVTVAIGTNAGGGTLSGTATIAAINGVATFSNLSIDKAASGYTLTAASGALTGATSGTFDISPAAASRLAFTMQPTSATAGASISPAVQVAVEDAFGNTVTGATDSITVAIGTNAGGGTLSGTTTVAAVNGVATFSDVSIELSGNGYTLTAASGALTGATSSTFNITHAAADNLAFTVQPSSTTAGISISPAVQVTIRDQFGNTITSATDNVTIAIGTNPGGGALSGTTTIAAVNGVATFSGLSIDRSGAGYTFTASSGALTGTTSVAFDITAAAADNLAFTVQPSNTTAGVSISPAVQVTIRDQFGNTVASATDNVTVAIGTNAGGGTLSGTTTIAAVNGVATFSSLSIDKAASGYTLTAASGVLTGATSGTFEISPAAASQLAFTVQPTNATAGASISPAVEVTIQDTFGNTVTTATDNVTVAIGTNAGGGTLSGTKTVAAVNGAATFSDLSLDKSGTGYALTAASGALTGTTSSTFDISHGAAAGLSWIQQPSNVVASAPISPAVKLSIVDGYGNTVTSSTANVTIIIATNPSGGTLSGTTTIAASAGIVSFANLSINLVGTGYTLSASSTGLAGSPASAAFNVTHGPLHHFMVEAAGGGAIADQLAGTSFNVRVTAQDEYNNTVTSFTGTVGFTSTPSGGISAGATSGAFTAGVLSSHAITFGTSGSFTLTATHTAGTESGTSNSFEVQAPPTAVNDGPTSTSSPGQPYHAFYSTSGSPQTFNLSAPGVMSNDDLGFREATIASFGGDSMGGSVTTWAAGTTVSPLPGDAVTTGSLRVNSDGSITFTPIDGFTGNYTFRYRLTNSRGTSDGQVTIAVGDRPSAVNDTYSPTLVGNVPINTATSTQFKVTANDQGDGKVLAITGQTGGTATINTDDTFTFRPTPGYEGPATFTYTVTNGFGTSAPATVSMTVANPVWFINAGAGAGGDGRYDAPFNSLGALAAINDGTGNNPAPNDRIFIYSGTYTGPLTMLSGQRLIGQGASAPLSSIASVTWPADAGAEPAVGGAAPVIAGATGGINLNSSGTNNVVRGVTIQTTGGTGIAGNSFGTFFFASDLTLNTSGGGALSLTNGTLAGNFGSVSSSGGNNNIHFSNVAGITDLGTGSLSGATGASVSVAGGTVSLTYAGNVTQGNVAPLLSVSGGHTGTLTFNTGTLSANNGTGLQFDNADGSYAFNGTTTLNGGDAAIDVLNTSTGTFAFSTASSVTNPAGEVVRIINSSPTFTYPGAFSKSSTGTGILVQSSGGSITFSGSGVTKSLSTGTSPAVSLSNNNGATINFTGGGLAITTTSGNGFSATSAGPAATAGGTINVTGAGNTITSTTGTALNLSNAAIGTSGLTFNSISASGGANGIVLNNTGSSGRVTIGPAISDGTCNSAVSCAGGAIQNTTGVGVLLTNTRNVSFTEVYIANTGSHGVSGTAMTDVTGGLVPTFEMKNSFMESPGDADNESALYFDTLGVTNITGRMVVSDTTIQNFEDVGLHVGNVSGTLTIDVTNVLFTNNSDTNGEEGIDVDASGTANTTVNVTGTRSGLTSTTMFTDLEGGGLNVTAQGSGVIDLNVTGVVVIGTGGPDNFPTPPAMTYSSDGASSTFKFDITNNAIVDSSGDGIFVGHEGAIMGRINNNIISGMATGDGIRIDTDAIGSNTMTIEIDGNNIGNDITWPGIGDDGIQILHRDGTKTLNLRITNNQIKNTNSEGIRYFADDDVAGGGPENALLISTNQFGANGIDGFSDSIHLVSQDAGTNLCAHVTGNTSVAGITLQQSNTAVLQITQASTAALSTDNGGATVTPFGTITFNGTCTNPPSPTNP